MNIYLLVTLCVISIGITLWLSTIRLVKPPSGELLAISFFNKIQTIIGNGIPKIDIPFNDKAGNQLQARIDRKDVAWLLIIWPQKVYFFDYRYKRFKTLKEIRDTKGQIRWQPTKLKNAQSAEIENTPDTIVLGEWKEEDKQTLFVRERDDIVLPFQSQDGIIGVAKGYIRYIVWEYARAVSSMHDIKSDPEKAILNLYRNWASKYDYLEKIKGANFDDVKEGKDFFTKLNLDIYETGIIVEDVYIDDFFIEKQSRDVLEIREKKRKAELEQDAAVVENKTKSINAEGDSAALLIRTQADAERTKTLGTAEADKQKSIGMAENEVKQDLQERLNETSLAFIQKDTDIRLNAAEKIIEKMIEYKEKKDVTEVEKWEGVGKTTGTVVILGENSKELSQFDNNLVNQTVANFITKKHKENETKVSN